MNVLKVSLLMVILFNGFSYAMMPDEVDPENMKYLIQQERDKALEEYNEMVKQKETERVKAAKDLKQGGSEDIVKSPGTGKIDKNLIDTEKGVKKFYVRPNFYFLLLLFCVGLYIIFSKVFIKMKRDEKGLVFVLVMAFMLLLVVIATGFIKLSNNEIRATMRQGDSMKALYIAEGGFQRALYDLKQDFVNGGGSPSWSDGSISTYTGGPDTNNFYTLSGYPSSLGGGNYTVRLKNITNETDEIWVRTQGTYNNVTRTVQAYVKIKNISPWNNAVFAGTGASGSAISGNVYVHGSVHVLGSGLASTDTAIGLSGTASVGNNYEGIPADLSSRIPPLPTVTFNGETVGSLSAEFRVKNGRTDLSGTAAVGQANVSGNSVKETMDGVYVDVGPYDGDNSPGTYYDGFGGNQGPSNVNSDNGVTNPYDLDDIVSFPSLNDPYLTYGTYRDYLIASSSAVPEDDIPGTSGTINASTPSFGPLGSGGNSISWNSASRILTISGVVRITDGSDAGSGGELKLGEKNMTIQYTGRGSLFSEEFEVHGDLLSQGMFPSTDALGLIADGDIELATGGGDSQLKMIGAFYAEGEIESAKQNEIAGSFVSNYFSLGSQVPKIYQVPALANSISSIPGFIGLGGSPSYIISTTNWQEVY